MGAYNSSCDISTGQCFCRAGVVGRRCDQCDVNMFGFSTDGCQQCDCDPIGSLELQCGASGQCPVSADCSDVMGQGVQTYDVIVLGNIV